jgi:hypothetical protein
MVRNMPIHSSLDTTHDPGGESRRARGRTGVCGGGDGFDFDWGFTCAVPGTCISGRMREDIRGERDLGNRS